MTLANELLSYYKENTDDFNKDIVELDSWTGCLGDDKIFPMDELEDFYHGSDPLKILLRAFYGYDDVNSTSEKKEQFNPNRDYFYINGYDNLVSTDKYAAYSDYLDEDLVNEVIANSSHLVLSDGAQEILDKYEDQEEEQDNEKQDHSCFFYFQKMFKMQRNCKRRVDFLQ